MLFEKGFLGVSVYVDKNHRRTLDTVELLFRNGVPHQWMDTKIAENRGPSSDAETMAFFADYVGKISKTREDITTWMALLDLDDYVTFGGKA